MTHEQIMSALESLYTAVVCDVMDSLGCRDQAMPPHVRPLTPRSRVWGRVYTARSVAVAQVPDRPYELEIAVVDAMARDDVLLLDGGDDRGCGLWGELLTTACRAKGVRGAVMTACTRDLWKIRDMDFPVFSIGCYPGDSKGRADIVAIGQPIRIGGVAAQTGDYLLGDEDGVAVIPARIAEQTVRLANEKVSGENLVRAELERGMPMGEAFRRYGIL